MPDARRPVLTLFAGMILSAACNAQQPDGDPAATEVWDPEPDVVTAGIEGQPPSDAIVLFRDFRTGMAAVTSA